MKHEFAPGTAVEVPNERIPEVCMEIGRAGYVIEYISERGSNGAILFVYNKQRRLFVQCISAFVKNIIPLTDFLCLVRGEIPESYCIKCTDKVQRHPRWKDFEDTFPKDWGFTSDFFFGKNKSVPQCHIIPWEIEITIETWAALNPVKEYPNPDNMVWEDGFDPSKRFEVSDKRIEWFHGDCDIKFIGMSSDGRYVVELSTGNFCAFEYIRNITEPEFEEGELVWYQGRSESWNIGTYIRCSDPYHFVKTMRGSEFLSYKISKITYTDGKIDLPK